MLLFWFTSHSTSFIFLELILQWDWNSVFILIFFYFKCMLYTFLPVYTVFWKNFFIWYFRSLHFQLCKIYLTFLFNSYFTNYILKFSSNPFHWRLFLYYFLNVHTIFLNISETIHFSGLNIYFLILTFW